MINIIKAKLQLHIFRKKWRRRNKHNLTSPAHLFDINKVKVGKGTYGLLDVFQWGEGKTLRIGAYCSIANGVQIFLGGEHRTDWVTTFPFNILRKDVQHFKGHPYSKGNVVIGNDVWIGSQAIILSGVTIGDGAVIGTRSVVTRDVLPYTIVAGNPASTLRKRFSEEQIGLLLDIQWWNWDDSRIEKAMPLLLSGNIDSFIQTVQ